MTFGERLRTLRKEKGMSQEELGRAVHVSPRVIGYYETDNRFPKSRAALLGLAHALGVSLDYLLDNPVRQETGCPSRFCYMKMMTPEERAQVNDYIAYLRYKKRQAEAVQEEETNTAIAATEAAQMIERWAGAEEAPAEAEAAIEEEPAEEDEPIIEEEPVEEAPAGEPEEEPIEEASAMEEPAMEEPAIEEPVTEEPLEEAPVEEATAGEPEEEPIEEEPFEEAPEETEAMTPEEEIPAEALPEEEAPVPEAPEETPADEPEEGSAFDTDGEPVPDDTLPEIPPLDDMPEFTPDADSFREEIVRIPNYDDPYAPDPDEGKFDSLFSYGAEEKEDKKEKTHRFPFFFK